MNCCLEGDCKVQSQKIRIRQARLGAHEQQHQSHLKYTVISNRRIGASENLLHTQSRRKESNSHPNPTSNLGNPKGRRKQNQNAGGSRPKSRILCQCSRIKTQKRSEKITYFSPTLRNRLCELLDWSLFARDGGHCRDLPERENREDRGIETVTKLPPELLSVGVGRRSRSRSGVTPDRRCSGEDWENSVPDELEV